MILKRDRGVMMTLGEMIHKRILLISGKGGVGRTTTAAALARAAARAGKRVLVADLSDKEEDQSPLARAFDHDTLTAVPVEVDERIQACHLWAQRGHELFFTSFLPSRALIRVALGFKAIRKFMTAAPSFQEMGIFYHLLSLLKETGPDGRPRHDLIIVDMPATGHTLALTLLPRILLRLISGGPVEALLREGQSFLNNPRTCAAWVVTLPETLPISEALELLEGLRESNIPVGGVILNRLPEAGFSPEEQAVISRLLRGQAFFGELLYHSALTGQQAYRRLRDTTDDPIIPLPARQEHGTALVAALAVELHRLVPVGSI